MRNVFGLLAALAAAVMFTNSVQADDRAEMADLQARIATLEAKLMAPSGGGDAESLTSANKTGQVRIGGGLEVCVSVSEVEDVANASDERNVTEVDQAASLKLRVDSGPDTWIYLKLDLEDEDDPIEEAHFVWENVRGSGLTFLLGEDQVFFGQDKASFISDPYAHGSGGPLAENADGLGGNNITTATASIMTQHEYSDAQNLWNQNEGPLVLGDIWQGERDNSIGIGAKYKIKDIAKLQATLFQERGGMHEDRSIDSLAFDSYALQLELYPIEGLELQASFINRHREDRSGGGGDDMDDINGRAAIAMTREMLARQTAGVMTAAEFNHMAPTGATPGALAGTANFETQMAPNLRALSLSADYTAPNNRLNIYGEYIHTWNAGWYEDVSTDTVDLGITYAVTEKLVIGVEGGWAHIDNDAFDYYNSGLDFDEELYKASIGASYTTDYGVTFLAEYLHEWYDSDLDSYDSLSADVVSFKTVYSF